MDTCIKDKYGYLHKRQIWIFEFLINKRGNK